MAYYDVDKRRTGELPGQTPFSGSLGPGGPGEKTASEYIVSGIPFAKTVVQDGNTNQLTFPNLTQWIIVSNAGAAAMKFGFTSGGVDNDEHFVVAATSTSAKFDVRTKSIWYDGTSTQSFSVMAGLTAVTTGSIHDLDHNPYWGV